MTGRGGGFCRGQGRPGYFGNFGDLGFRGRGRGGGRGWRNQFHATGLTGWQRGGGRRASDLIEPLPDSEQEAGFLKSQAKHFENALDAIRRRIERLEPKPAEE
jgi:hypothetical protein